jgi:hypothetical protein
MGQERQARAGRNLDCAAARADKGDQQAYWEDLDEGHRHPIQRVGVILGHLRHVGD